jgi:Acetyltransferase (GNAT) domain
MDLKITTYQGDCLEICQIWNNLVEKCSTSIFGIDVTCTFEWATTLRKIFLGNTDWIIVVFEDHNEVIGILPLYKSNSIIRHMNLRKLCCLTELYSGRSGFILREYRSDYMTAMIKYLWENIPEWDIAQFTLVDNSELDSMIFSIVNHYGYRCRKVFLDSSPYILLDGTWQTYFNSLPKKFRWHLRNSRKKMEDYGRISYRSYNESSNTDSFLEAMMEIERSCWKETPGTSITTNKYQECFYKEFMLKAIENQWFYGRILELNDEPIAYIYGLYYNGIFYDLKESYKVNYKEISPGHVLKTFLFEDLYQEKIQLYDFMGTCEAYKMRWTNKTYSRSTYTLYNKTVRGMAAWVRATIESRIRATAQH